MDRGVGAHDEIDVGGLLGNQFTLAPGLIDQKQVGADQGGDQQQGQELQAAADRQ